LEDIINRVMTSPDANVQVMMVVNIRELERGKEETTI
jgi:hypothetical protein